MSDPTLAEYGVAAYDAYNGTVPPGMTLLLPSKPALVSDGFSAEALLDSQGNIIIAYEGTSFNPLTSYGRGAIAADDALMGGQTPQALVDAIQFAEQVQTDFGTLGKIFVTGHSLGGTEAEAAAQSLGVLCAGGVTFGALCIKRLPHVSCGECRTSPRRHAWKASGLFPLCVTPDFPCNRWMLTIKYNYSAIRCASKL